MKNLLLVIVALIVIASPASAQILSPWSDYVVKPSADGRHCVVVWENSVLSADFDDNGSVTNMTYFKGSDYYAYPPRVVGTKKFGNPEKWVQFVKSAIAEYKIVGDNQKSITVEVNPYKFVGIAKAETAMLVFKKGDKMRAFPVSNWKGKIPTGNASVILGQTFDGNIVCPVEKVAGGYSISSEMEQYFVAIAHKQLLVVK